MDATSEEFPRGQDYLEAMFRLEDECEDETGRYLPHAGTKAPQTWERLGTSLALLDALSSCGWGCHGGDHVVEYLLGRVVGSVRAGVRLARGGLYDESFNALRTAGEIVNLLTLFQLEPQLLEQWRDAPAKQRFNLARPGHVMSRLKKHGRAGSSMNPEKYDLLSRIAHGNTTDAPQAHNAVGLPLTAGRFQEAGLLVTINEAAVTIVLATAAGVHLIDLEPDTRRHLLQESRRLIEFAGAVTLASLPEALAAQRPAVLEALEAIAKEASSCAPETKSDSVSRDVPPAVT